MFKKISYIAVVCFLWLSIAACRKYNIELGSDYTWKLLDYTSGETVVVDSDDKIVIGPGGITLWAKYPWIYGRVSNNNGASYWAINIKTKKVIDKMSRTQLGNFRNRNGIRGGLRLLATWGDVTVTDANRNKNLRVLKLKEGCRPLSSAK